MGEFVKKTKDGEGVVYAEVKYSGGICEIGVAPSMSAAVRSIEKHDCANIMSHPDSHPSWYGRTGKVKDIIKEAHAGQAWPEDAKQASSVSKSAFQGLENFTSEIVVSLRRMEAEPKKMVGLSIDRLLDGSDLVFKNKRKRRIKRETIGLFVPINALYDITPKTMMFRMAATMAAAQILEAQGQCVEIYSVAYSTRVNGSKSGCAIIKVKSATAPLNLEQAASAMSAWAFRTVGFAFRGTASKVLTGSASSGSGCSEDLPYELAEKAAEMMHCDHFDVVKCIPRGNNAKKELKNAVDAVVKTLLKIKSKTN